MVGLRLNIPNRWWPGYDDGGLNRGHIAAIDFNASNTFYFQVELDDEPGAHYAMRYDSVVLYADEEQRGFSRYRLPSHCPGNPDDEIARVPVPKKYIGWMVDDDYTDQEDVAIDEAIEFEKNEDDDHDDADADDNDNGDDDKNKTNKLDHASGRTTGEGHPSHPVHWASRVFPSECIRRGAKGDDR